MTSKKYKLTNRKTKRKTKKKSKSKFKNTKFNYELHYFKMNQCKWCTEFEKKIWKKIKKKNIKTKVYIGSNNPTLVKKYNIMTYPSLVRISGKHFKLFNGERTMNNILQFLR